MISDLMKHIALAACAMTMLPAQERLYVNDQKVPEAREDLMVIQKAVQAGLPKAREATVCIQIGGGSGTGVVVSSDGLVMTAAHVSAGVKQTVKMKFEDGTEVEGLTLGLDSERDAAMIQIVKPERDDWPHVKVDKKDSCQLGDWVFALGHSGGFDKERGVVVRLGRLVKLSDSTLHSDCILIGGDSGGPLFDLNGTLVGIHSRVGMALQENMHVPCDVFIENWDRLKEGEFIGEGSYAKKPVLGNGFLGIATEANPDGGVVITQVGEDSPAAEAGLKVKDVLLTANEAPLSKREDLKELLKGLAVGDEITFELKRGDEELTIKVKLGER